MYVLYVVRQELDDLLTCAIAQPKPNKLRRRSVEQAALMKVRILGYYGEAVGASILPYLFIGEPQQATLPNVCTAGEKCRQQFGQLWRQIFVKQQLHWE